MLQVGSRVARGGGGFGGQINSAYRADDGYGLKRHVQRFSLGMLVFFQLAFVVRYNAFSGDAPSRKAE